MKAARLSAAAIATLLACGAGAFAPSAASAQIAPVVSEAATVSPDDPIYRVTYTVGCNAKEFGFDDDMVGFAEITLTRTQVADTVTVDRYRIHKNGVDGGDKANVDVKQAWNFAEGGAVTYSDFSHSPNAMIQDGGYHALNLTHTAVAAPDRRQGAIVRFTFDKSGRKDPHCETDVKWADPPTVPAS
jgi:hypothetical protein